MITRKAIMDLQVGETFLYDGNVMQVLGIVLDDARGIIHLNFAFHGDTGRIRYEQFPPGALVKVINMSGLTGQHRAVC